METITTNQALKAVHQGLTQQTASTSGQTVMLFNSDGTPAGKMVPYDQQPSGAADVTGSIFTLEASSNPAISVRNQATAEAYEAAMGGYAVGVADGKVYAAKLNTQDWNYLADGTAVSSFASGAASFETMIHVPDCHYLGSGQTLNFGGLTPVKNGHTFASPHWVGAYKMYVDGSSVGHSRPDVAPSHTRTMSSFWTCAQNLGSDFGLANYQFHCLVNALYQARFANLNSQETIGAGFQTVSGGLGWDALRDVPMGLLRELGDGSGKVAYTDSHGDAQQPVKLFGFEDLWGKLWEFRPGIRFYYDSDNAIRYAVVYDGNQVSNTATGRTISGISTTNGWATVMGLGEYWDMIGKTVGGSSATYYSDYWYANTTGEFLRVGGAADAGADCGVSCANSSNFFGHSRTSLGARLAFYGEPEIVSGAELLTLLG